jgi:hypothetical protein
LGFDSFHLNRDLSRNYNPFIIKLDTPFDTDTAILRPIDPVSVALLIESYPFANA